MAVAETKPVTHCAGASASIAPARGGHWFYAWIGALMRWSPAKRRARAKMKPVPEMSPDLRKAVSRIIRDDLYEVWLQSPNRLLDGKTPAELLRQGNESRIREALDLAEHGEGS